MSEKNIFKLINQTAKRLNYPVYVVGGYVRDMFLNKAGKDIDFVVVGDAMKFADSLKQDLNIKNVARYPRFGTFMFNYKGYNLEFVNAREESYTKDSRNPNTKTTDLFTDLSRRDFTINTLAMDISDEKYGEIIDVYDGRKDLEKGIIRTPLAPGQTFNDDPLRMLRAIRFATRFNFKIESKTFEAIKKNAQRLNIVSVERITDEFNKIILNEVPSKGIRLLDETDLLKQFLPELDAMKGIDQRQDFHHKDVFNHTLEVLDNLAKTTDKLETRLAGLLHDIAKPKTKRFVEGTGWTFHGHEVVGERMSRAILKRLKYSNEIIDFVKKLVLLHLRPMALISDEVTDAAVRRVLFLAGEDFDDLMLLCRADITSKNPAKVKRYLNNYDQLISKIEEVEERDRVRNFQPPVDGKEIMQIFNTGPGPLIGRVKKFVEEAILEGEVPNEHDACVDLILKNKNTLINS